MSAAAAAGDVTSDTPVGSEQAASSELINVSRVAYPPPKARAALTPPSPAEPPSARRSAHARLPPPSWPPNALQASGKTCTGYFREIQFLSTLTLLTSLSGTNSSWTFTTGQCSMEWVSATMPVSQLVYQQDTASSSSDKYMAWCYSWCVRGGVGRCAVGMV